MFRRERAERPGRRRTHCVTWRKGGIMIDQRMLDALLNFEPLPEDVKKRMACLDRGDGILDPFGGNPMPEMMMPWIRTR